MLSLLNVYFSGNSKQFCSFDTFCLKKRIVLTMLKTNTKKANWIVDVDNHAGKTKLKLKLKSN